MKQGVRPKVDEIADLGRGSHPPPPKNESMRGETGKEDKRNNSNNQGGGWVMARRKEHQQQENVGRQAPENMLDSLTKGGKEGNIGRPGSLLKGDMEIWGFRSRALVRRRAISRGGS